MEHVFSFCPRFHSRSSASPPHSSLPMFFADSPHLCHLAMYLSLQALTASGEQGECRQVDGERGQERHSLESAIVGIRHRARCFKSLPHWLSSQEPHFVPVQLCHILAGYLGAWCQLDPELLFPRRQDGAVSASIGVNAR